MCNSCLPWKYGPACKTRPGGKFVIMKRKTQNERTTRENSVSVEGPLFR